MKPEQIGARKLLLGLLVMAVGVAVDAFAKNGLTANLLDLLKYIGMSFFAANGVEHLAAGLKSLKQDSNPDVAKKLEEIQKSVDTSQQALAVILQAIPPSNQKAQQ